MTVCVGKTVINRTNVATVLFVPSELSARRSAIASKGSWLRISVITLYRMQQAGAPIDGESEKRDRSYRLHRLFIASDAKK